VRKALRLRLTPISRLAVVADAECGDAFVIWVMRVISGRLAAARRPAL
jgi:hypothetical protein